MIILASSNMCTGCGACFSVCSQKSITMEPDIDGFLYPQINKETCIQCKKCVKVCPAIEKCAPNEESKSYALINNDENIRCSSSSGGFFTSLAEYTLDNNGLVFGATLNANMYVQHICIDSKDNIPKLRGSKYVQSSIEDTYLKAKESLDNNQLVLFSGTPCQIDGLIKFLGKKYNNLITQDLVCHGVPSPMVWKKYLQWQQAEEKSSVINASFRNKSSGWKAFSMKLEFDNGNTKYYPLNQDFFLRSFLSNLCLRPSCYNCNFKGLYRSADFTLADFWGVNNIVNNLDDDLGTSLVMINSKKAFNIFNSLKNDFTFVPVDTCEALKYNSAATSSVVEPSSKQSFMSEIKTGDFKEVVNKYAPTKKKKTSLISKIIRKLNNLVKNNI